MGRQCYSYTRYTVRIKGDIMAVEWAGRKHKRNREQTQAERAEAERLSTIYNADMKAKAEAIQTEIATFADAYYKKNAEYGEGNY